MSKFNQNQKWESGWEGHQKAQALRWAALSFRDKVLWLEEAQTFLIRSQVKEGKEGEGEG